MRTTPILLAAVLFFALTTSAATAWSGAKDVFAEVAASVVVVLALDEGGKTAAQGSGVAVGAYEVVTNCHVLEGAADIRVRQAVDWSGGRSYRMTATVLARDESRDLCLLFVDELPLPPAAQVVRLGNAKVLSVGEEVYAVGAPAGLELSLSRGIVSQLRGTFGKRLAPLVQTDAAISPGSSGGGLFNRAGELVGITTFKQRGENLNFAMPAEWVEELRAQGRPLVKAMARAGCVAKPSYDCVIGLALDAANDIKFPFLSSDKLRDLAATQAAVGDVRGGQRMLRAAASRAALHRDILSVRSLAKIAIAQNNMGDEQAARRTFSNLRAAVDEIVADPSHPSRNGALGLLAAALAQSREVRKAMATVLRIDEGDRNRFLALAEVAQAQAEAGDAATATRTALSIDEDHTRNTALATIAHMQAKGRDYAGALETVTRIDDESNGAAAFHIAAWQLVRGDHQAAEQTIASTISRVRSGAGFLLLQPILGLIHAKKGNFDDAIAIAESFDVHDPNESAVRVALLNDIAVLQGSTGDALAAKQTLESALKTARGRNSKLARAVLVSTVAAAQGRTGDLEAARRSFADVALTFKSARKMDPGDWGLASSLRDIAIRQAEAGFISMAMKTAFNFEHVLPGSVERLHVDALVSVARSLAGKPPLLWWYPRRFNFFWVWDRVEPVGG